MNELAKTILQDGQPLRAIQNYLQDTFDGIKNKYISNEEDSFTDRIEFLAFVKAVSEFSIKTTQDWKDDDKEGYDEGNTSSVEETYKEIGRREMMR
jgi:hypothetical protein